MVYRFSFVLLFVLLFVVMVPTYADGPLNGGFESGDLTGFTFTGNGSAQVLTVAQIAPLSPTEGSYFALVGNGPGDQGGSPDRATLASAYFSLSTPSTVSFDYDFLTAEFTGADSGGPSNLDTFNIRVQPVGGVAVTLAAGDTGSTLFTYINLDHSPVTATDGTSLIEHTGYHTGTANLMVGNYSLQFTVADAGDNNFDSALMIDNIRVESNAIPSTVPEPGTTLSLCSLCLMLAIASIRAVLRGQANGMSNDINK